MGMECIVEYCDKASTNKHKPAPCAGHKAQQQRYDFVEYKPLWYRMAADNICQVPNCNRAVKQARLCVPCRKKRYRYGLTVDELIALDLTKCEICGNQELIYIDHDHTTGKFRGVLCIGCNSALGYMKENKEMILRLAAYLD